MMEKKMDVRKQAILYACGNYSRIVLTLLVNALLARIISADDYGLIAVITVFSTLFITLSDFGIGPAIVQIKDLKKDEMDDIFSITILFAFILTGLFMILSTPIAYFYENKVLIPVGYLLSISIFFGISNMVPNGILNRNKNFIFITVRNICVYSVSSLFSIILALLGVGIYAVVLHTVISSILTYIVDYIVTKPKLKFKVNKKSLQKIMSFSCFQFAFNIVCYISRNLDNILTGKYISTSELGYYSKAYTLMLYPINNLTGVFIPVLHPIMSDYQKQPGVILKKYVQIARLCMLLGAFVSVTCFVCSSEIILILYGNNWIGTIECFKWMSIAIVPQMMNSCVGAIYQSIGNTKLLFVNSCVNIIISILAIILGVFYFKNIVYLSCCISVAYFFHFFAAHFMLVYWGFKQRFLFFIFELKKEFFAWGGLLLICLIWTPKNDNVIISFGAKFIFILFVYICILFITKDINYVLMFIKGERK